MGSTANCPICGEKISVSGQFEADTAVRCPVCDAQGDFAQILADSTENPIELAFATEEALNDSDGLVVVEDDQDEHDAHDEQDVYAIAGEAEQDASEPEAYDFGGQGPSLGLASGETAAWRSRQPEPSATLQIVKFFGMGICGVLGIAFAYLILSVISPANFDFLNLWGRGATGSGKAASSRTNSTSPPPTASDGDSWPGLTAEPQGKK